MPKVRLLPKDIAKRPDSEVAEKLFGKKVKRELDKLIESLHEKPGADPSAAVVNMLHPASTASQSNTCVTRRPGNDMSTSVARLSRAHALR